MPDVIATLSRSLYEWMTPDQMVAATDRLNELLGNRAMLRIGRAFREGHIAARFAARRGAGRVRLLKEDHSGTIPDFEIEVGCERLRYETSEVDVPGRKRQDEYRDARSGPVPFSVVHITELNAVVEQMRALAAKKAAKCYANCEGLVIWVNPPGFFFSPEMRWGSLVRGGEPAARAFREVWAFRGEGSLLWKDGAPQPEVPGEEF